ncbi:MAG: hypothetical protein Q4A71_07990 [Actinomycetaceae bacterium]|nr:hypothetical protein [Actinomycetaceae bacterium]
MIFVGLILAALAFAVSAWFRLGKSARARSWTNELAFFDPGFALLLFPGVGILVVGMSLVGLGQMVHGTVGVLVSGLALLLCLVGAILVVWGASPFKVPRWLYPKWAK